MHGYHPLDIKNGSDTATAHVAVITAVVLVLGLFARWMDHRKRWRSSHLSMSIINNSEPTRRI